MSIETEPATFVGPDGVKRNHDGTDWKPAVCPDCGRDIEDCWPEPLIPLGVEDFPFDEDVYVAPGEHPEIELSVTLDPDGTAVTRKARLVSDRKYLTDEARAALDRIRKAPRQRQR